jgi:Mrp family chromosome partitioning ATPase
LNATDSTGLAIADTKDEGTTSTQPATADADTTELAIEPDKEPDEQPGNVLADVSAETLTGVTELPGPSFKPQWEVDSFRWPKHCLEIDRRLATELDSAVASIRGGDDSRPNVYLICSESRQAGRSTVALCLARRAALAGLRVALVDLDCEQPSLMNALGVATEFGIESLGQGQSIDDICIAAINDRVTLCPLVRPTQLARDEVSAILDLLADHHDLVVIDAAPGVASMLDSRHQVGAVIVEDQRPGATTTQATKNLADQLSRDNVWTAGVVKNFAA